ncbi:MAG: hypothetical protein H6554_09190 [Chitinophagales bacterium]|nr:hypothetical protein [Chitinophagales bacterium]
MQHYFYKISIILLCLMNNLSAQDLDLTIDRPTYLYSYFTPGHLQDLTTASARGMASLSAANRLPNTLNFYNPAALTNMSLTTFDSGFDFNRSSFSNNAQNIRSTDANIAYLSMGFPVAKFWTTSVGLNSYSRVNYDLLDTQENASLGNQSLEYLGEGQLYRIYWGNGFKILPSLSVGVQGMYHFGHINKTVNFAADSLATGYTVRKNDYSNYNGFSGLASFQWHPLLRKGDKPLMLIVGSFVEWESSIKRKNRTYWNRLDAYGNEIDGNLFLEENITTDVSLPSVYGVGFSLATNNWLLGIEAQMHQWGDVSWDNSSFTQNDTRIALGGMFVPSTESTRPWLQRVSYRMGLYYHSGYLNINEQAIQRLGLTFGFGLPLSRKMPSTLNLSFDLGQKGTTENSLYQENYFFTTIGINLNDKWFIKRKFD